MKKLILLTTIALTSLFGYKANAQTTTSIPCNADFTYEINYAVDMFAPGIAINFYDKSEGDSLSYFWDFGDGTTSTEKNPMHVYFLYTGITMTPIKYIEKAVVTHIINGNSCNDSITKVVYLNGDTTLYHLCSASFDFYEVVNDSMVSIPEIKKYQFTGYSNDSVETWYWDFGNGIFSTEQNPQANLVLQWNDTYNNYGTEVALTITTTDSCTSSFTQFVPWNNVSDSCWVYFTYYRNDSVLSDSNEVSYQFTTMTAMNSVKEPPMGQLLSSHWDFGDGTTSEEINPLHTFQIPQINCAGDANCIPSFYVSLTATFASGCVATYGYTIYPIEPLVPDCNAMFSYTIEESLPPVYQFFNQSTWYGGQSFWSFGDETYSYEANPTHVFSSNYVPPFDSIIYYNDKGSLINSAGYQFFTVCLTINDSTGCTSTYCENVYAYADGNGSICNNFIKLSTSIVLGNNSCNGTAWAELVDLNGNPVSASSYYWSNGSISPSISSICSNTTYSVSITNYDGCTTASSFAITDYSNPWPYYGDWGYENKDSLYIFNYYASNPDYNVTWNFSDGTQEFGLYVPHTFTTSDSKWVELVVTDNNGNVVRQETIMIPNVETGIVDPITDDVLVYPVPAFDVLNIDLKNLKSTATINIVDIMGKTVLTTHLNSYNSTVRINLEQLKAGIYVCRIITDNNVIKTTKIIKK
jgi:PKD repeat protein